MVDLTVYLSVLFYSYYFDSFALVVLDFNKDLEFALVFVMF